MIDGMIAGYIMMMMQDGGVDYDDDC